MPADWLPLVLDALGGGLPAIALIAMGWEIKRRGDRIDLLTDRNHEKDTRDAERMATWTEILRRLDRS